MINHLLRILVSVLWLSPAAATTLSFPVDDTFGTPPPRFATDWTRFSVLGDREHLFLVVWVSPHYFRRSEFERISVLTGKEYTRFVNFVRSVTCSRIKLDTGSNDLLITRHTNSSADMNCVLPPMRACDFLASTIVLQGVHWTESKAKPLMDFSVNIGCHVKQGLSVPHALHGRT